MTQMADLIDMTSGGVIPGQTHPGVMPRNVLQAPAPTTFTAGPTAEVAKPSPASSAPAIAAPVMQQPQAQATQQPPATVNNLPRLQTPTGMSVTEDGRVNAQAVGVAPASTVAAPIAIHNDPLHNQLFGTAAQGLDVPQQQVPQPAQAQNVPYVLPVAQVEIDDDDVIDVSAPWSAQSDDYEEDGELVDHFNPVVTPAPVMSTPVQTPAPVQTPVPSTPAPTTVTVPTPTAVGNQVQFPSPNTQSVTNSTSFPHDDEVAANKAILKQMEDDLYATSFALGIALLSNPQAHDEKNPAHEAIWFARWNPGGIMNLDTNKILSLGVALSTHQVWVAGEENKWTARCAALKEKLDELILLKQSGESGKTKQERELAVIKREPEMRELDRQYTQSKYMAAMLLGMADRFAQLENSLKRPADRRAAEEQRNNTNRSPVR